MTRRREESKPASAGKMRPGNFVRVAGLIDCAVAVARVGGCDDRGRRAPIADRLDRCLTDFDEVRYPSGCVRAITAGAAAGVRGLRDVTGVELGGRRRNGRGSGKRLTRNARRLVRRSRTSEQDEAECKKING